MRLNEFIEKYGENLLAYYMPRSLFEKDMEFLGWNSAKLIYLKELDSEAENDIICVNANFYTKGVMIGIAPKSYIQACCETEFMINNETYTDIVSAVNMCGKDILYNIDNWDWKITKEWVINSTKDHANLAIFDSFEDCPKRKTIGG